MDHDYEPYNHSPSVNHSNHSSDSTGGKAEARNSGELRGREEGRVREADAGNAGDRKPGRPGDRSAWPGLPGRREAAAQAPQPGQSAPADLAESRPTLRAG